MRTHLSQSVINITDEKASMFLAYIEITYKKYSLYSLTSECLNLQELFLFTFTLFIREVRHPFIFPNIRFTIQVCKALSAL